MRFPGLPPSRVSEMTDRRITPQVFERGRPFVEQRTSEERVGGGAEEEEEELPRGCGMHSSSWDLQDAGRAHIATTCTRSVHFAIQYELHNEGPFPLSLLVDPLLLLSCAHREDLRLCGLNSDELDLVGLDCVEFGLD